MVATLLAVFIPGAWLVTRSPREVPIDRDAAPTSPGRLSGRVVNARGEPIDGAQVGVSGDPSPQFVSTGPDGRFEFGGLEAPALNVFATAPRMAPSQARRVALGASDVVIVLEEPATIRGSLEFLGPAPAHLYVRLCHHDADFGKDLCVASRYYAPPTQEYQLDRLAPGAFEVVFVTGDVELARVPVTLQAAGTVDMPKVKLRLGENFP